MPQDYSSVAAIVTIRRTTLICRRNFLGQPIEPLLSGIEIVEAES